jgi:signal transduction histidine kinase
VSRARVRLTHWELAVVAGGLAAAAWLRSPGIAWAAVACVAALAALVTALAVRKPVHLAAAAAIVVAAIALLTASVRGRAVEDSWPSLVDGLLSEAAAEIEDDLGEAVLVADRLADRGSRALTEDRTSAFGTLDALESGARVEFGVVTLDRSARPWAWAGKVRTAPVPTDPGDPTLITRITPFYVVLEASRQTPSGWAFGQVLLQADSAVPDREASVARRFQRRTGVAAEFFPAGADVAGMGGAVFDYCRPACTDVEGGKAPDTLLTIRLLPPSQGAARLELERLGGTWGAVLTLVAFGFLLVAGLGIARWVAIIGAASLLVFTPAGSLIGLEALFSPANFYLGALGPFTSSAGALLLSGVLVVTVLALAPRRPEQRFATLGRVAFVLAVPVPFVLWWLVQGATPQSTGTGELQWLSWQLPIALSGVALGLIVLIARPVPAQVRGRVPAGVLTTLAAIGVGYVLWDPTVGWPWWYGLVWIPPLVLGAQAPSPMRGLLELTVVAGAAAALLTWNADVRGRLLLAQRDTDRLLEGDPVAIGLLERFGEDIVSATFPESEAELYARWRRSPLSRDDYPAALAAWSPGGTEVASVELAALDVSPGPIRLAAGAAREAGRAVLVPQEVENGVRYLLAAPFEDGAVVTVIVGPRSRLIAPVLEARFLRGQRRLDDPYEMSLGELVPDDAQRPRGVTWARDRAQVRGIRVLDLAGGARHLHIEVPLRGAPQLAIRGVLVVLLNMMVVGVIVVIAAGARRGFGVPNVFRDFTRLRAYRTRLAIALAAFFVIPALGFTVWSVTRIRVNADRSRDLLIQQTLRDASGAAGRLGAGASGSIEDELSALSDELGADLFRYQDGMLEAASTPVLEQLGLVDPYLPPRVFARLLRDDLMELNTDAVIGGQRTRVGYRALGAGGPGGAILAAPRLVDVSDIVREQEDLVLSVLLAALLGLASAGGLAVVAARSLARPVQALRTAALAVGRGEPLSPFLDDVPAEFVPVVDAFERMVSDIDRSQTALEAARRRMATVLANVATGVVALNPDLRVTVANPRAAELLGQSLPAGQHITDVGAARWAPVWDWTAGRMEREEEMATEEFTIGERRIRAQVAALHTSEGGCVLAIDDITDLARAVRVLAWGELAQQIAHEIKNPLTPIRLGIQHLQRARRDGRADFDHTLERTSQQILAEIERLDAIARAFARFGAPPAEAEPLAETDLGRVAKDTADLYRFEEGSVVRLDRAPRVIGLARADEAKEVLINLIENARDAGATEIVLSVDAAGQRSRMTVQDNGRGITAEHLVRVFEPQFSTTSSGTGLGLAICRRLVEGWGGGDCGGERARRGHEGRDRDAHDVLTVATGGRQLRAGGTPSGVGLRSLGSRSGSPRCRAAPRSTGGTPLPRGSRVGPRRTRRHPSPHRT